MLQKHAAGSQHICLQPLDYGKGIFKFMHILNDIPLRPSTGTDFRKIKLICAVYSCKLNMLIA